MEFYRLLFIIINNTGKYSPDDLLQDLIHI